MPNYDIIPCLYTTGDDDDDDDITAEMKTKTMFCINLGFAVESY